MPQLFASCVSGNKLMHSDTAPIVFLISLILTRSPLIIPIYCVNLKHNGATTEHPSSCQSNVTTSWPVGKGVTDWSLYVFISCVGYFKHLLAIDSFFKYFYCIAYKFVMHELLVPNHICYEMRWIPLNSSLKYFQCGIKQLLKKKSTLCTL